MEKKSSLFAVIILALSVTAGFLFSILFLDESIGISFPFFMLVLIIGILFLKYLFKGKSAFGYYDLLFIPIFITSFFTVWHQNQALLILNGMVICFFFLPVVYFSLDKKIYTRFSYLNAHLVYLHNLIAGLIGTPKFLSLLFRAGTKLPSKGKRSKSILLNILFGCLISVPVIIVFASLFILADDAFKKIVSEIDIDISFKHIFVAIFVSCFLIYVLVGTFISSLKRIYI